MGEVTCLSGDRPVMTAEYLRLPGLCLLGRNRVRRADDPLPLHDHDACFEFVLLLKGEESYYVEGAEYHLQGGDVFVSFPGQLHRNARPYQGVNELLWFILDPTAGPGFLGLSSPNAERMRRRLQALDRHLLKADRICVDLVQRCFEAFVAGEDPVYCVGLFAAFLSRLLAGEDRRGNRSDGAIRRVIQYIERHLDAPIRLSELSEEAGLSLSGLKHRFREETGRTPLEYINARKIECAKDRLLSGKSVTHTALDLGFSSSDYFSVVFKKYTRLTPTEFIRASQGDPRPGSDD